MPWWCLKSVYRTLLHYQGWSLVTQLVNKRLILFTHYQRMIFLKGIQFFDSREKINIRVLPVPILFIFLWNLFFLHFSFYRLIIRFISLSLNSFLNFFNSLLKFLHIFCKINKELWELHELFSQHVGDYNKYSVFVLHFVWKNFFKDFQMCV